MIVRIKLQETCGGMLYVQSKVKCSLVCGVISNRVILYYTNDLTPLFLSHTCTCQLLDKPWSQVSSLLPPGSCLEFFSRIGFSNPTARRFFIECCQLTSIDYQVPGTFYWYNTIRMY